LKEELYLDNRKNNRILPFSEKNKKIMRKQAQWFQMIVTVVAILSSGGKKVGGRNAL